MFCNKPLLLFSVMILVIFSVSTYTMISPLTAQGSKYSFLYKWGSQGVSVGQFAQPFAIAIDTSDDVYVTDTASKSNNVQKFTKNGTFVTS